MLRELQCRQSPSRKDPRRKLEQAFGLELVQRHAARAVAKTRASSKAYWAEDRFRKHQAEIGSFLVAFLKAFELLEAAILAWEVLLVALAYVEEL